MTYEPTTSTPPRASQPGVAGQVPAHQAAAPWPAPVNSEPIHATVPVPGSKSLTNRLLVLAALADGPSTVHRPLAARDSSLMVGALRSLGVGIDQSDDDASWQVTPGAIRGGGHVDCGLAGTVMRFVPPLAGLADAPVTFDGDPHARRRPTRPILEALRELGVRIDDGDRGALPFTVHGSGAVPGGDVTIDASASSQFVSALLLAGARLDMGLRLRHSGPPVPSLPHIEMTLDVVSAAGVSIAAGVDGPNTWWVEPGPIQANDVTVEPDLSNAAPFLAAALVTGGEVRIPHWPHRTAQPAAHVLGVLTAMGAQTRHDDDGTLVIRGTGDIAGIDVDLHDAPELPTVVAAVAALADGPTTIRGVAHIRGHETDRLAALRAELTGLGADVDETHDGLIIRPRPLHGGIFHTYADHRMAHAAAVLGLAVPGIEVDDIGCTTKTLADFPGMWTSMLGEGPTT